MPCLEALDRPGDIVRCFSRIAESRGIGESNKYLLTISQLLLYEVICGSIEPSEASRIASELRDAMLEVADMVNPFIQSILGIVEEGLDEESVEEALERASRLWREDRLDKLEV